MAEIHATTTIPTDAKARRLTVDPVLALIEQHRATALEYMRLSRIDSERTESPETAAIGKKIATLSDALRSTVPNTAEGFSAFIGYIHDVMNGALELPAEGGMPSWHSDAWHLHPFVDDGWVEELFATIQKAIDGDAMRWAETPMPDALSDRLSALVIEWQRVDDSGARGRNEAHRLIEDQIEAACEMAIARAPETRAEAMLSLIMAAAQTDRIQNGTDETREHAARSQRIALGNLADFLIQSGAPSTSTVRRHFMGAQGALAVPSIVPSAAAPASRSQSEWRDLGPLINTFSALNARVGTADGAEANAKMMNILDRIDGIADQLSWQMPGNLTDVLISIVVASKAIADGADLVSVEDGGLRQMLTRRAQRALYNAANYLVRNGADPMPSIRGHFMGQTSNPNNTQPK